MSWIQIYLLVGIMSNLLAFSFGASKCFRIDGFEFFGDYGIFVI
jgi:hypothetical protein